MERQKRGTCELKNLAMSCTMKVGREDRRSSNLDWKVVSSKTTPTTYLLLSISLSQLLPMDVSGMTEASTCRDFRWNEVRYEYVPRYVGRQQTKSPVVLQAGLDSVGVWMSELYGERPVTGRTFDEHVLYSRRRLHRPAACMCNCKPPAVISSPNATFL